MTEFFLADMHFGNVTNARKRGFAGPSAMDEVIVAGWRSRVADGDLVWVLGDVGAIEPLRSLPDTKHLVLGNDDRPRS